jgi:hypothetical protein
MTSKSAAVAVSLVMDSSLDVLVGDMSSAPGLFVLLALVCLVGITIGPRAELTVQVGVEALRLVDTGRSDGRRSANGMKTITVPGCAYRGRAGCRREMGWNTGYKVQAKSHVRSKGYSVGLVQEQNPNGGFQKSVPNIKQ